MNESNFLDVIAMNIAYSKQNTNKHRMKLLIFLKHFLEGLLASGGDLYIFLLTMHIMLLPIIFEVFLLFFYLTYELYLILVRF